jgi:hypothetical protein
MRFNILIILSFVVLTLDLNAQKTTFIEGKVFDRETNLPLAYANISNQTSQTGTITNADGYFRISLNSWDDSLSVSYLGYKDHLLVLKKGQLFYQVNMERSTLLLNEVIIKPEDDQYMVDLIQECRHSGAAPKSTARAYYELKSQVDGKQIELVEAYFNLDIQKYSLKKMHFKTGRIAIQPFENRFFTSMESSKALIMLDLLKGNEFFPINPLELSGKQLKKQYYLYSDYQYLDQEGDSIHVIDYQPKDKSGNHFEGKIWINTSKKTFNKITLCLKNASTHPFLPLFPFDKIVSVRMDITISYNTSFAETVFNHMDFSYIIDYESRNEKENAKKYTIQTSAVLYAYQFQSPFFIPLFDFKNEGISDYRKISAFPYNDYFWHHHQEYSVNDSLNTNELYFNDIKSLTNQSLFKPNQYFQNGIFEHEFIQWSKNRLKIKQTPSDPTQVQSDDNLLSKRLKLSVKIFLDLNTYGDSFQLTLATVFDPYDSEYQLAADDQTQCFINTFFDLCEIQKQLLENKLEPLKNDPEAVISTYHKFLKTFESEKSKYTHTFGKKTNSKELKRYNQIVLEKLGIDNMLIFQPDS